MMPDFQTSPRLRPFRHGFFGRGGGCSEGDYSGLNCGLESADDPARVRRNRRMVASVMGTEPDRLVTGRQTHSADVAVLGDCPPEARLAADGFVTKSPSIAIGVLTADCLPVLLADPDSGVVGAAHAGWRGALAGILENTVEAMAAEGASRAGLRAVIGPAISPSNYEVGPEFHDEFLRRDPQSRSCFIRDRRGRLRFDLPAYGKLRLARAGVENADWTGDCTYADASRFFSWRRACHHNRSATGLLIAVIAAGPCVTEASGHRQCTMGIAVD